MKDISRGRREFSTGVDVGLGGGRAAVFRVDVEGRWEDAEAAGDDDSVAAIVERTVVEAKEDEGGSVGVLEDGSAVLEGDVLSVELSANHHLLL